MKFQILILAVLCAPPVGAKHSPRGRSYDISYIWSRDLGGVQDYRNKVAKALGPEVEGRLLIVKDRRYFGLVFDQNSDGGEAFKTAKSQSLILKKNKLHPAAPMHSKSWSVVAAAPREPVPVVAKAEPLKKNLPKKDEPRNAEPKKEEPKVAAKRVLTVEEQSELEKEIERHISELRRSGRLGADETTAWSVYDFTSGEKIVTINEDKVLQAASMVKPFFALAFFHEVQAGRREYTPQARAMLRRMIQHSNNAATNWVIRELGGPAKMHAILKNNYGEILEDTKVVEYIPPGGRTYRNKASANDYSRFLSALWKGSIPGSAEIKHLMKLPSPDRISDGAQKVPRGTIVYSKTGSTKHLCGDMGILVGRGNNGELYPYSIVGVIEKGRAPRSYTAWIRSRGRVIRDVSSIIYESMARRHDLLTSAQVASTRQ